MSEQIKDRPIAVEQLKVVSDRSSTALVIVSGVLAVSVALNAILLNRASKVEREYFAVDEQANIVAVKPTSEPVYNRTLISEFASRASRDTFSWSFDSYKDDLRAAQHYWDSADYELLLSQLSEQGYFAATEKSRLLVRTIVEGTPQITREGRPGNNAAAPYQWLVEVPVTTSYVSPNNKQTVKRVLQLTISRADIGQTTAGIQIVKHAILNRAQ